MYRKKLTLLQWKVNTKVCKGKYFKLTKHLYNTF